MPFPLEFISAALVGGYGGGLDASEDLVPAFEQTGSGTPAMVEVVASREMNLPQPYLDT